MKVLLIFGILLLARLFEARKVCVSSGDPHYTTYDGFYFDLYRHEGDFMLTSSSQSDFEVQTRIKYGKHWSIRGLNSAVAVRVDGNIVIHNGHYYKINGEKNGKLQLLNGATISRQGNNRFLISSKAGERVIFDFYNAHNGGNHRWSPYYFNVYIHPVHGVHYRGLCGDNSGHHRKRINMHFLSHAVHENLFKVAKPPHKLTEHVPTAKWESPEAKEEAKKMCLKMKLIGRHLKWCMTDLKEGHGNKQAIKGFKKLEKDIKTVDKKKKFIKVHKENKRAQVCVSSGDPHYHTYDGFYYDMYRHEGDFVLTRSELNNFEVQTRIKYGRHWSIRGLNSAVAIKVDGNVIIHNGHYYKINGVKNGELKLLNGAKIMKQGHNKFLVQSLTGERVVFDYWDASNGGHSRFSPFYFNVYVHPDKKSPYFGLCGINSGHKHNDRISNFLLYKVKDEDNLFKKPKEAHMIEGEKVVKTKWDSVEEKKHGKTFCKKMNLKGKYLKWCLTDLRESHFNKDVMKGYKGLVRDIKIVSIKKKFKKLIKRKVSNKVCYATGDPHYKTYDGHYYDLYRHEGDFVLTRSDQGNFEVHTRIKYGKHWSIRGLNSAVVIFVDDNIFMHNGRYYKINGVVNGPLKFKHGAKIVKRSAHSFLIEASTGEKVAFDFVNAQNGGNTRFSQYYFNLYINPIEGQSYTGLCGPNSGHKHRDVIHHFHHHRVPKRDKLFKTFKKVKKVDEDVDKRPWKSEKLKKKALHFCLKVAKLQGHKLKWCLIDAREGGLKRVKHSYKKMRKEIRIVRKSEKKFGKYLQHIKDKQKKQKAEEMRRKREEMLKKKAAAKKLAKKLAKKKAQKKRFKEIVRKHELDEKQKKENKKIKEMNKGKKIPKNERVEEIISQGANTNVKPTVITEGTKPKDIKTKKPVVVVKEEEAKPTVPSPFYMSMMFMQNQFLYQQKLRQLFYESQQDCGCGCQDKCIKRCD